MKKKIILFLVLALAAAAAVYACVRVSRHGTDIIGVTTLADKNTVIMNSKTGSEFVSGSGVISVAQGEHIHLECDLKEGSIDVAFRGDEGAAAAYESMTPENLPTAEEMTGEGAFGQESISGKCSLDFDAEAGEYTVYIANRGAVGKAVVTAAR